MKIFTYVKNKQKNRVKKKIENEQKEGNIDERRAKYKAAVSQCTSNRETTALLIISKRVQKITSFTTLASVYAKGKMFSAY